MPLGVRAISGTHAVTGMRTVTRVIFVTGSVCPAALARAAGHAPIRGAVSAAETRCRYHFHCHFYDH